MLEPSEEVVSAEASGAETEEVSAAEAFAASDKTVENGEIVEAPAADSEEPVLAEPVLVDEPATGSIAVEQAEPATLTAPTPQVEETITVEPDDTEEEIVDFRHELATHNADKLNETERGLAEDFATIAFGTNSEDRLERVQKRWENETVEATPSDGAEPKTNSIPQTRREAMGQENPAGLRSVLKKFFLN